MTARSPTAFFLSATLHGLVVAAILLFSYLAQISVREPPKILELVAGPGDDYGATEAPKLGVPGGVKIDIPEPAPPAPTPPSPVQAAPVEPEPVPAPVKAPPVEKTVTKTTPKAEPKPPNFSNQIKRKIIKAESKAKAEIKKEREAEAKRISKAEFDAKNRAKASGSGNPKTKHIDTEGVVGGAVGGSANSKTGAGGKALTREEGDLLLAYYALVKQRLQEGLEKPPGLSDTISADVEFQLNSDGSISSPRITRGSGSDEFDRAVMDAIRHFRRVSPPKTWRGDTVGLTFRMKEEE